MRIGLIALVISAAAMVFGGISGCNEAPAIKVVENVGVTDSPQTFGSSMIEVVETIGVTDSPRTLQSVMIRITETIGVTDFPRSFPSAMISVTETIGVTDSPSLAPAPQQPPPPPVEVTAIVTSPEAGEVWRVGTAQDIGWATTGEGIAYVDIYYSTDGGKSMIAIAQQEPDDGMYTWKVPNTPSKTALVRVLAFGVKGETLASGDSGLFTISIQ